MATEVKEEEKVIVPERLEYFKVAPGYMKGLMENEKVWAQSGLDESLYHLIKLRASQINGCAYCLDMHTKDAQKLGETTQRLIGLDAWRESNYYTAKERAALEWTEAVTLISEHKITDDLYNRVKKQFTDKEMLALTIGIIAINSWNRLAIPFHTTAGNYQPAE